MMTRHSTHAGFTLIEMLVSVALFSVVMVVALGALLSMSVATRKAEAINSAVNNLGAAIDSMSRAVRTGFNYHCGSSNMSTWPALSAPQNCTFTGVPPPAGPQPFFAYTAFDGTSEITYCLSNPNDNTSCNTSTTCTGGTCSILRQVNGGTLTTMTAPEVNITSLAFYAEGTLVGSADNMQPKVTMVVSGIVSVTATQSSKFNIQTTVTQRVYDQ